MSTKKKEWFEDHPILRRAAEVKKAYVEEFEGVAVPTNPQEFLDWLWDQSKDCQGCILSENRTTVVKPDGTADAVIMVVLEGPGFLEDLSGVPLVGPAELRGSRCGKCFNVKACFSHRISEKFGKRVYGSEPRKTSCTPHFSDDHRLTDPFWLHSTGGVFDGLIMKKYGFNFPRHNWITQHNEHNPDKPWTHKSPWYITNTIMCRSFDKKNKKDIPPPSVSITTCKKWFTLQWAAVQPRVIVALGTPARDAIMGAGKTGSRVIANHIVDSRYGPLIYNVHPASIMRERDDDIKAHAIGKLGRTLDMALELALGTQ